MLQFDIALQQQLISAVLDDFSPNDALPSSHGGQYGENPSVWREAVMEFLGVMLDAGLIAPLSGKNGYTSRSAREIVGMLRCGDQSNGLDAELLWDVIHFTGTEKLQTIMRDLGLATWEARKSGLSTALKTALTEMSLVAG